MELSAIRHPEYLHIHSGEELFFGANQEWYDKLWQRRAGCGPTAASMAMSYLLQKQAAVNGTDRKPLTDRNGFTELMNEVWHYVTPGYRGVNSTSIYIRGCREYAKQHNLDIDIRYLNVLGDRKLRPSAEEISAFIQKSLQDDCPVAFLNLHNGDEKNLDRWHWVLLVSFDAGSGEAVMYDQGLSTDINIYLWLNTTVFGGGFVTIDSIG